MSEMGRPHCPECGAVSRWIYVERGGINPYTWGPSYDVREALCERCTFPDEPTDAEMSALARETGAVE